MKKDKLFFQIMKKIFLGHHKELRILILCETILTAISYAIVSGYQMFSNGHSSEYFMQEDGISKSFLSAGTILLFCGIILIITVLISYLGKRIPEYVFLQRMGISKKDLKTMVLYEAAISYLVSIIAGFFVGKILTEGLKILMVRALHINFKLGRVAFFTYPSICILILFIYGLSFLLVKELQSDFLIITNMNETARIEKLEGKFRVPKIMIGIILCIYSVYAYSKIYHYESAYLIIAFFAGLYLSLRNIFSIFLERIKHKKQKKYYKNLLMNHRFYYRMNTVSRYILFFSLMSFLSCFYFGIQFISTINAEKAESLYPYDFMCVADKSDDKLFEKIKEKYHATLTEYPMVRVANADKTEHLEGRGEIIIQGQQIGISESTYYKLKKAVDPSYKKKSLNLDKNGKKVYVVHQQDRATKAQPVDWYYNKKTPTLHIGLPCEYCDYADHETTYDKKIEVFSTLPFTDREIISLFGNLLDNALEACEKINDKERWIKIKIKKKNLLLYIEIANALEEMPKQIQKEFVSNKKDNGLHGYGMKNIQDIVKKYDGIFEYKVYEDHLIFMISIYNN